MMVCRHDPDGEAGLHTRLIIGLLLSIGTSLFSRFNSRYHETIWYQGVSTRAAVTIEPVAPDNRPSVDSKHDSGQIVNYCAITSIDFNSE